MIHTTWWDNTPWCNSEQSPQHAPQRALQASTPSTSLRFAPHLVWFTYCVASWLCFLRDRWSASHQSPSSERDLQLDSLIGECQGSECNSEDWVWNHRCWWLNVWDFKMQTNRSTMRFYRHVTIYLDREASQCSGRSIFVGRFRLGWVLAVGSYSISIYMMVEACINSCWVDELLRQGEWCHTSDCWWWLGSLLLVSVCLYLLLVLLVKILVSQKYIIHTI